VNYTLIPDLRTAVEMPAKGMAKHVVYQDDRVKIVVFAFAAGHELAMHSAPMAISICMQSGEARLTIGDENLEAGAGAFVHLAPELPHALLARTDVVMVLQMYK
jgi:quercetin dioxygenase-like cupin family protein